MKDFNSFFSIGGILKVTCEDDSVSYEWISRKTEYRITDTAAYEEMKRVALRTHNLKKWSFFLFLIFLSLSCVYILFILPAIAFFAGWFLVLKNRFNKNKKYPICLYGNLEIYNLKTGVTEHIYCSKFRK